MLNGFEFSEELLQAVSQLDVRARRNIGALLAGNYRSAFRGSGMQFKEFRRYEAGDDIRHMSWPVTARTGHATIKVYEEERDLDILLMIDASGSSLFGLTHRRRKIDMYAELVALIGLASVRSGDNVGLLLFTDKPGTYLEPKRSRNQVLNCLAHILRQPLREQKSDLRPALEYAEHVLRKRSLIIVFSDFLVPNFDTELLHLSRRHELVIMHCFDDAERGMQLRGVYEVWDPETNEFSLIDGNSQKTKALLAEYQTGLSSALQNLALQCKADYVCLSKEDDYFQRLVQFFRHRGPAHLS